MKWSLAAGLISLAALSLVGCDPVNPTSSLTGDDNTVILADVYEQDNTGATAKYIYVDSVAQSRTLKESDIDWVKFTAVAGRIYTIKTSGAVDTRLALYSSYSSSVPLEEDDDGAGSGTNALIEYVCTSSGTYYFTVIGATTASVGSGSYTLQVTSVVGPDSYENDDVKDSANSIGTSGLSQSHSLSAGDVDWVRFTVSANDSVVAQTSGSTDTRLYLYASNGTTLITSDDDNGSATNALVAAKLPTAGTYYLKVAGKTAATLGNYSVAVTSSSSGTIVVGDSYEVDNVRTLATAITIGSVGQSHTFTAGDTDWVSFSATSGSSYTIQTSGSIDTKLSLVSASGTELVFNDDDGTNSNALISWTCTSTGTYYVRATGFSLSTTGSYGITVSQYASGIPDEYEDDDNRDSSSQITVDGVVQSHTFTVGDTDWVSFPVVVGSTYRIETSGSIDTKLYLYNEGSSSYATMNDDDGTGSNALITWTATGSGTCYVMAIGFSSSTAGMYGISVLETMATSGDTFEYDNVIDSANGIVVGAGVQSHTFTLYDVDWVSFSAEAGKVYTMQTSGSLDTKLYLYSSDTSSYVTYNDDDGTNNNALITWTCTSTGSYYLKAVPYSSSHLGNYGIAVAETDTIAVGDTTGAEVWNNTFSWDGGSQNNGTWIFAVNGDVIDDADGVTVEGSWTLNGTAFTLVYLNGTTYTGTRTGTTMSGTMVSGISSSSGTWSAVRQ